MPFIFPIDASNVLEFQTTVQWHESNKVLKVNFPLDLYTPVATFDTQFGCHSRPTHNNTSWDMSKFEVIGHRFADLSEFDYGVALINNGKVGYHVKNNIIQLSLLRSSKSPDPIADMGIQNFKYAIYPHLGHCMNSALSRVIYEAFEFNHPMMVGIENIKTSDQFNKCQRNIHSRERILQLVHTSIFEIQRKYCHCENNPPLLCETFKLIEESDDSIGSNPFIIRIYEPNGGSGKAILSWPNWLPITRVTLVNGLEEKVSKDEEQTMQFILHLSEGNIEFDFRPFQIITFQLDLS